MTRRSRNCCIPTRQPPVDPYTLLRHQPAALLPGGQPPMGNVNYMYYLVNTKRPLEEKMALFWHHRVRHRQLEGRQLRSVAGADRPVPQARHGQLSRPAAEDREEPDDDLLARQQPEPRHRGQRELGPRTARTVQPRRRQLHRGGCPRMLARLHRLDLRDQDPAAALWAVPVEVRVPRGRSR